jgi:hypothetical protein
MTTALEGVRGQRHAPAALYPRKDPVPIVQEAGWAPGSVWIGAENLAPHRDSIPGPSDPLPVAIATALPGPPLNNKTLNTMSCFNEVSK